MREQATEKVSGGVDGNGESNGSGPAVTPSNPGLSALGDDDVTVYDAIRILWQGKRTLGLFVGAMLLAGTAFLLGSRSEYRSTATLMPEKVSEQGLGDLGAFSQFSGLLGASIPSSILGGSATEIPPDLYPEIAKSTALQLSLLRKEIFVPEVNQRMSLYRYLDDHKPFSLWETAVGLPGAIMSIGEEEDAAEPAASDTSIIHLTPRQEAIVEDMRDRVRAEFDIPQGVVEISVAMPDAQVSAQVADAFVNELTNYVSEYRSDRQRRKTEFIQELHDEARTRFDTALRELANFKDTHRNLARDMARAEEQRLQAEYDLSFSLYNSLSSRLEEARIQLQDQTPVFKVLQPVTVPLEKSFPPTLVTLLLCGLLGFLAGSGFLFFRPAFSSIRDIFRSH